MPKETAFVGRSQLTLIGVYAQFVSNIVVIMETDALGETWDANGAILCDWRVLLQWQRPKEADALHQLQTVGLQT